MGEGGRIYYLNQSRERPHDLNCRWRFDHDPSHIRMIPDQKREEKGTSICKKSDGPPRHTP